MVPQARVRSLDAHLGLHEINKKKSPVLSSETFVFPDSRGAPFNRVLCDWVGSRCCRYLETFHNKKAPPFRARPCFSWHLTP